MPKINVAKAFRLTLSDGSIKQFDIGEHNVEKEIAEHWFVKANLVGAAYEPKVGSYEYAIRGRAQKSEEEAVMADLEAEAATQAKADAEARAADLMEKTNQTIAAVAQQAQDVVTKNDQQPAVVSDLPPIPLGSAPGSEQSQSTNEQSNEQAAETGEQKAE